MKERAIDPKTGQEAPIVSLNTMLNGLDLIIGSAKGLSASRQAGNVGLFDDTDEDFAQFIDLPYFPDTKDQMIRWERELLGFYVSGHPCDPYWYLIGRHTEPIANLGEHGLFHEDSEVVIMGSIEAFQKKVSKKNTPYAVATLEDTTGSVEVMLFSQTYAQFLPMLEAGGVVIASGMLREERRINQGTNEPGAPVMENEAKRFKMIAHYFESAQEFCESFTHNECTDAVIEREAHFKQQRANAIKYGKAKKEDGE